MPSPSNSLATLRPDITDAFEELSLEQEMEGYIASRVLPIFDVEHQSGTYPVIPIEELLKSPDTKRSNRGAYNRREWKFKDVLYRCEEHGEEGPVDERAKNIYKEFFDAEVQTVSILRGDVMRAAEQRVSSLIFDPTAFASQTTNVTNEWDSNHVSDANPIEDVKVATFAIYDRTGVWPNALVINRKVFKNLKTLDVIKAAIESSGAGSASKQSEITASQLAQVFDLDEVIVAGGSVNTANEGRAAEISQIWSSQYAMVTKVAKTNRFVEPCIGRTLHWGGDGSVPDGTVDQYPSDEVRADIYRVRHDTHEKKLYPEVGQLLTNVTTSS